MFMKSTYQWLTNKLGAKPSSVIVTDQTKTMSSSSLPALNLTRPIPEFRHPKFTSKRFKPNSQANGKIVSIAPTSRTALWLVTSRNLFPTNVDNRLKSNRSTKSRFRSSAKSSVSTTYRGSKSLQKESSNSMCWAWTRFKRWCISWDFKKNGTRQWDSNMILTLTGLLMRKRSTSRQINASSCWRGVIKCMKQKQWSQLCWSFPSKRTRIDETAPNVARSVTGSSSKFWLSSRSTRSSRGLSYWTGVITWFKSGKSSPMKRSFVRVTSSMKLARQGSDK